MSFEPDFLATLAACLSLMQRRITLERGILVWTDVLGRRTEYQNDIKLGNEIFSDHGRLKVDVRSVSSCLAQL